MESLLILLRLAEGLASSGLESRVNDGMVDEWLWPTFSSAEDTTWLTALIAVSGTLAVCVSTGNKLLVIFCEEAEVRSVTSDVAKLRFILYGTVVKVCVWIGGGSSLETKTW